MRLAPSNASAQRRLGAHAFGALVFVAAVAFGAGLASLWAEGTRAPVRFAVIGDYGRPTEGAADVAGLVRGWEPDFVITLGDNNYNCGEQATIEENIDRYYGDFITGDEDTNRFFPVPGNHDWGHNWPNAPGVCKTKPPSGCPEQSIKPYTDRFALYGNERYYDFRRGPVHFFALDSDCFEPDGITKDSTQGQWLRAGLKGSAAPHKLVYMHHPPFSSGSHGPQAELQWPFKAWGATAVLAGHEHSYERLYTGGLPYIVNGSGGRRLREFKNKVPASLYRNACDYGAMLVTADDQRIDFKFYSSGGTLLDECSAGAGVQTCWKKGGKSCLKK